MMRDEEKIRDFLKNTLDPIHAHDSVYAKVMLRMQTQKRGRWSVSIFYKRLIPLTLILFIMAGIVFPVFGKEGTFIDVYNSYRVHRNLNILGSNEITTGENTYRDTSIGSFYLSSLLEKEYDIEPGSLLQIKAQNPDDRETVALIVFSKIAKRDPSELISLRQQNLSWGRICAFYGIKPREALYHFENLRQKIWDSMEKRFIVRGVIDSINNKNGVFYITGCPFPIQITLDTERPSTLEAGMVAEVNVIDYGDSQNVQALKVVVLKEEKIGFIMLRGEVLERDVDSVLLQLRTMQKVRIQLSPRILEQPNQMFLRSGTLVQMEVSLKKNDDGNYMAYRWRKIIPLPRLQNSLKR